MGASLHNQRWDLVLTNLDGRVIRRSSVLLEGLTPENAIDALSKGVKQITADLDDQRNTVEELAQAYEDSAFNARDLQREADAAAKGGLRNISGAFAGALVGSLAFGAGMTAITALMPLAEKALQPLSARLTGYIGLTNDLTKALSDQAREQHGLTGIVVSGALAQAAIGQETANAIRPALEQREDHVGVADVYGEQHRSVSFLGDVTGVYRMHRSIRQP